jgi:hypothetical protein
MEYDFQKSRGTGPWNHKVSVSAKKIQKKMSCLCTFKVAVGGQLASQGKCLSAAQHIVPRTQ